MILLRHCLLLALIVAINADTVGQQPQPSVLQKFIDFIRPYTFDELVDDSSENVNGSVKNSSAIVDAQPHDESDEEEEDDDDVEGGDVKGGDVKGGDEENDEKKRKIKFLIKELEKIIKKKKKKPSTETPQEPVKPDHASEAPSKPDSPDSKPSKPESKPPMDEIKPAPKEEPSVHDITPSTDSHATASLPFPVIGIFDGIKNLPASFPKRKVIMVTSTQVAYTTLLKTIYPSCLKMLNVRSMCDDNVVTLTPTISLESESPSTEDKNREGRILNPTLTAIEPTSTIPADEMTVDARMLPYLLKPKFEYTTEFIDITTTKDVYDLSQTATVVAVNCLPVSVKTIPLCPPEKPTPAQDPADAYHSKFLEMIKAQDAHEISNLTLDEILYLYTKVIPTFNVEPHKNVTEESHNLHDLITTPKGEAANKPPYEVTEHVNEPVTEHDTKHKDYEYEAKRAQFYTDAIQKIPGMIYQYLMDEQQHRTNS